MKDVDKDRGQLIDELEQMRQRIEQLEAAKAGRKDAANRLIDSEIRYRRLFETAQDGILILDGKTGQVTDANPFLERMLGYSHEDFIGKKLWEIGPFKDIGESKIVFRELQQKGYVRYEHLPLQAKDGREIAVEFVSNVYKIDHTSVIQCNIRDITERKRVEEVALFSEAKYRAVVENANEIIIVVQDNMSKFSNPKAAEITGYSLEELTSRPFMEFIHPDDRQTVMENYSRRLKGDTSTPVAPVRILDKNGNVRWMEFSWSEFIWEGKPALLYLVIDVTERKKIEEALKQSESRYKELAESITDVFFAMDEKLRYTYWNKASEELTGVSAKDALGKRLHDIFPVGEATRRAEMAYRKVLTMKTPQHFINSFPIGGRDFVFDISAYPTKGGLCVYVKDVTERTKLEKALKESELWYRHIFDNAPFGIGFSLIDGKVINLNKAMETITGYSAEEFNQINLADTYVNKADREALLQELRRQGSVADYLVQLRRKDGTPYDALLSVRLTTIGDKEFIQTICHDVTERKRAEEALRESEERYRALVELSPEAIFVASEGKHVFVNSAGLKLFGASSPDQIMGKPVLDIIHPDYRKAVAERMRKAMETGITPPTAEEKFLRLDGTAVEVEMRAAPLIYQGKPAMQAVVRDISERKKAEESLRLSEQNFRDSIEKSPLGIRIVTEHGRTLYVNRALLEICGYGSFEELKVVSRKQIYALEDYIEHRKRVEKRKLGEYVPPNYEISIVRKDGQIRNLAVSRGEVLWDGERQFQVVYQDITERKTREEEYQAIIRTAIDGFWQADIQGHFLDVNEAYCQLTGYSRDELLNMLISDVEAIEKPVETAKRIRKVKEVGYGRFETRHRRKDGEIVDVEISVNYLPIDSGRMFIFIRDITQRKRAEEQLQQEKDRAQRYLDIAGVMLMANDAEGRVSLINRKGCEVLGYEQEEIIGKNWFDTLIPERVRHEVKAVFNKLMTGEVEPVAYFENPVLTKSGEERIIAWHNVVLKDRAGNIVGTLSSGDDVTERKKTEDRVSIQRDLGMALGATYSLDEAMKLCLEAALKISGLDCGGIYLADSKSGVLDLAYHKGLSVEFVKSVSHYEADSVNVRLVMAGEPIYSRHTEFGAPLDTVEQREGLRAIAIMPVFYENHVIGCLNVASHTLDDVPVSSRSVLEIITAQIGSLVGRIKSRQELQTSEARYRLLAENVRDVIWATDMDFRFTYVSPSVKYLGDRTAEEAMSLSLGQLLTPSSQELVMKAFAEELVMANRTLQDPTRSRTLEVELIRSDGSTLWAELKVNFMRDPAGRPMGILGVMRDITERKKAEDDRRALEQKAQLASRLASVGELAAGVAHEINNPLTGVIGYAELLMQENVPEHIKNDLEIIRDGAKRVADIVKGLLKFARQTRPERTIADINQVIEVALRLRAYELETNNIKVNTNLASDLPLTIADPGQLQQVFLNLLINAEMEMKLARGKGKLIIKTEQVDNNIRICFKDDGPGITKENLERIFDPFFTTRETGKGTGLGLSICHGIVTEHGGRIWAESKLGKGATFIVELPIVTEEKRPRRAKPARKPQKATKGRILVVDDEPVVRRLLSQILTEGGHEVEATDDAKDALNRIKNNGYSLILLDMKLPGMSGGELYERIQAIAGSLAQRVVFITGDVMGADTEAIIARTKVPCITKPFDVEKLKVEIRRLLATPRLKGTSKPKIRNPKP